ncbi:MAG TPA: trypsin-like serine protease [Chthoniobacteraceae bacterium]|jgi:hypothetical protein|nr:trypsin-like serine protease [Chthoniobacteraceae bacterium]
MRRFQRPGWLLRFSILALFGIVCGHASAVEILTNGTASYNTADPGAQVPDWTTGWGENGIDGWDYVGQVNGAVGVYLGDDWVLTAGHVGAGNLIIGGVTYDYVPGTAEGLTSASGSNVDLTLFQLASGPDLPTLELATQTSVGESVVMIGEGGGHGMSWGDNTITTTDLAVEVSGYNFYSCDFETAYGPTGSGTNDAVLVPGDSGGGNFTYDATTGQWMLVGINEAVDSYDDSYMVQVSSYLSQIQHFSGVPEPGSGSLALLALPLFFIPVFARHKLRGTKTGVI